MAKKIVSVILAFCMIFSCFVLSPAVSAVGQLVHEHSHFASVHGAHLNYGRGTASATLEFVKKQ